MNKKILTKLSWTLIVSLVLSLTSCKQTNTDGLMSINGTKVKLNLIDSGYYFDVASLSEVQLEDMIDRVVTIERPENLGEVEFSSDIEKIVIKTTTPSEVTNQELEAEIEKKRDRFQEERIVEEKRTCKIGDTIIIDITAIVDGVEDQNQKMENNEIVLGQEELVEELEAGIIGKKAGVNFDVDVVMPKDFEDESVRGKKVTFKCFIKYMKEKITPIFDDEFALAHSRKGATSSITYKKELMDEIQLRHENGILENEKNNLLEQLYGISIGTPSEEGMAWAFSKALTEQKRLAKITERGNKEMLTQGRYTLSDVLYSYKMQAPYLVAEPMLLDALQKKYCIAYTEDDKMKWFDDLCIINDYGSDVTYELYSNSMGEAYIDDNARKDKILKEVLKHVKKEYITPEEMEQQEQGQQMQEQQ